LEAIKNLKEDSLLPKIFSTNFIEEGKLILAMTDHDPNKRPDAREVYTTFWLIWQYRDAFRKGEYDGDLDKERFISYNIDKYRGLIDSPLGFDALKMWIYQNFDERLEFKEEFFGKCSFGEVILRRYKDGTQLAIKRMVLNKFDEKKIGKLLSDVVQIVKIPSNISKDILSMMERTILFFRAGFDLNKLTLFTQTNYCQDSLVNWMRSNQDRFNEKKKFRVQSSIQFFLNIALGIRHMKRHNLVHRDLKPSNIFLGFDNNWKISDYGLSRLRLLEYECEQDYYESLIKNGVPVYAAPEQVKHLSEDSMTSYQQHLSQFKVDIFSFGLIVIEYLIPKLSKHGLLFETLENIRNKSLFPESLHQSIFETGFYELILGMVRTNHQERLDISEVVNKYETIKKYKIEEENVCDKYHSGEKLNNESTFY
jgi:serine/threonine protein kinase